MTRSPGPGSYPKPRRPFGLARVQGDSMRPTLESGDRLVVRYGARVPLGGLVVARFADGTLVVKRAAEPRETRQGEPGWWLLSDDPETGVDSRHRGVVAERDIVGAVVARLWPHPAGAARL